jgi:hypothetical protein
MSMITVTTDTAQGDVVELFLFGDVGQALIVAAEVKRGDRRMLGFHKKGPFYGRGLKIRCFE